MRLANRRERKAMALAGACFAVVLAFEWTVGQAQGGTQATGQNSTQQASGETGKIDILEVRRHVLASIPDSGSYFGVQAYWKAVINGQ